MRIRKTTGVRNSSFRHWYINIEIKVFHISHSEHQDKIYLSNTSHALDLHGLKSNTLKTCSAMYSSNILGLSKNTSLFTFAFWKLNLWSEFPDLQKKTPHRVHRFWSWGLILNGTLKIGKKDLAEELMLLICHFSSSFVRKGEIIVSTGNTFILFNLKKDWDLLSELNFSG